MQFKLLDFKNERYMQRYELDPPHLINDATLLCTL